MIERGSFSFICLATVKSSDKKLALSYSSDFDLSRTKASLGAKLSRPAFAITTAK